MPKQATVQDAPAPDTTVQDAPAPDTSKLEAEVAELKSQLASALEVINGNKQKSQTLLTKEEAEEKKRIDKEEEKKAIEARTAEIDAMEIDDKAKQVLKLYESGMQQFAIAQKVYDFVNQDTVSRVALIIRREYADDDFDAELKDVKGYTGV